MNRPKLTSGPESVAAFRYSPDVAFTVTVVLVALLPRLFVAIAWAHEPVWDGHYYDFGAERIAAGFGYSEDVMVNGQPVWKPWSHYPVGYSAFLAAGYATCGRLVEWLFGSRSYVAPLGNALIGALTAGAVHRLARYFMNPTRARIAGAITALHPGLIVYTAVLMSEPLTAFLLVTTGWTAVAWRGSVRGVLLAGVILGLATLVRPSALLAAPLLVVTQPRPWRKALLRGTAATILCLAVVLPWTARNCRVMDGCALVSTNAGWNLAIGALSDTGRFVALRAKDGCPVVTGQVQQDRCWGEVGRRAIARDPWSWAAKIPQKLAHTFSHESFAIEYLREADPHAWPEARRVAGRDLLSFFHRLLLATAALAVVGRVWRDDGWVRMMVQGVLLGAFAALALYAFRDDYHPFQYLAVLAPLVGLLPLPGRPWQGPVGRYLFGLILAAAATHAVFFGDDRYHLVVTPAYCILAAAALRKSYDSERDARLSWE
ncbi:MAG: glycosyltransferase family 39 protein [Polyangiaceae bacterium]|nr:glycosyltransferase family 39 protein [Polyangiaceae bacterium]